MIKVETKKDDSTGIFSFAFECSTPEELESLDLLRVAFLGEHPKRGGYVTSSRLVIEAKIPETTLS